MFLAVLRSMQKDQKQELYMQVGMKPGYLYAFRIHGTQVYAHRVVRFTKESVEVDTKDVAVFVQPRPPASRTRIVVMPRLLVAGIPELLRFKYGIPPESEAYWGVDAGNREQHLFFTGGRSANIPLKEIALYPQIVFKLASI